MESRTLLQHLELRGLGGKVSADERRPALRPPTQIALAGAGGGGGRSTGGVLFFQSTKKKKKKSSRKAHPFSFIDSKHMRYVCLLGG